MTAVVYAAHCESSTAFDGDDRRWLVGRRAPQGRFNAGQKLNAVLTAAFALLFAVSGTLLWLGERNTSFRFDGTIVLHDGLTLFSVVLLTGHLYLALIHPTTRHALRGVTRGDVRVDWAREHHAKWVDGEPEQAWVIDEESSFQALLGDDLSALRGVRLGEHHSNAFAPRWCELAFDFVDPFEVEVEQAPQERVRQE